MRANFPPYPESVNPADALLLGLARDYRRDGWTIRLSTCGRRAVIRKPKDGHPLLHLLIAVQAPELARLMRAGILESDPPQRPLSGPVGRPRVRWTGSIWEVLPAPVAGRGAAPPRI